MLELVACPDPTCGAPAEVTDRFGLSSTNGAVPHVKTYCARRHIYLVPEDRVDGAQQMLEDKAAPPNRTSNGPLHDPAPRAT